MSKAFTMHDLYNLVCPPTPDTWSVGIRMTWSDRPDYHNTITIPGYTSSTNAIVAADVFSTLGEDIVSVFYDHGQFPEYNGQCIEVSIMRVPGVDNGHVRY